MQISAGSLWRRVAPSGVLALILLAVLTPALSSGPAEPSEFTFVVLGDNRPNRPNLPQSSVYKQILKDIEAVKPAFVVNTGDFIYGSEDGKRLEQQYREFIEVTESLLHSKVYLTVGNHEVRHEVHHDFFQKELGTLYYSFDYGGCHFIVLDSEIPGRTGRITGDQLEWLREDLHESRAARHKFVFLHRPLYPIDGHVGTCLDRYPEERNALHRLFTRNRIDVVFAGHEHLYDEHVRNGVQYIITGGGGAFLYPSIYGKGDFHHYVVVSVTGDRVRMKVVKPASNSGRREEIPVGRTVR